MIFDAIYISMENFGNGLIIYIKHHNLSGGQSCGEKRFFGTYEEFRVSLDRVWCYYKHPIVKTEGKTIEKCKHNTGR